MAINKKLKRRPEVFNPNGTIFRLFAPHCHPMVTFVEEICQIGFTARFSFPVYQPRKYVTCGYQDNLGFGFNTAIGVKIANPDKCVVSVSGDGGFMFGVQELATAVHHRINLVTIIFNNNAYGNVLRDQKTRYDGRIIGAELTNPNFVLLAESFGAKGLRVTSPDDLKYQIIQGFKEGWSRHNRSSR